MQSIELIPLCRMTFEISAMFPVGRGLFGSRGIGEIVNGRLEGERLRAEQLGHAAADWGLISDDGFVRGDIRIAWRTDDGAALFTQYTTFMDVGKPAYSTPEFESGDERYGWLNRVRIVGKGNYDPDAGSVVYQLYEMR